ncbi:acetylglutamate kinase [Alkalimonas delamerensis]|uniref:Acetylglutamate kinase n=1 Tax=Alkalimonas delamerensis TaxID=265981 RepID=A0ABT9GLM8_9GAMM|nr:acetylglutamate kinase [Alkalimonas delamerensis]MDP4527869.1 acetylglutamate kinase [Alkalimonas delamerensis]
MTEATPLVVKLGGRLLQEPKAIAELLAVCQQIKANRPLLLVHGGGAQVESWLHTFGFVTEKVDGQRVSPPEQMPVIAGALAGAVNAELVALADQAGLAPVGLTLGAGGSCRFECTPALGAVAKALPGQPALLQSLLQQHFTPVLSSIGHYDGALLNVNADLAAAALCQLLQGDLLLLTDVPGILQDDGRVMTKLSAAEAKVLVAEGVIKGGMKVKLDAALDTAQALQRPIVVAGWQQPELLLPLLAGQAVGTRIYP